MVDRKCRRTQLMTTNAASEGVHLNERAIDRQSLDAESVHDSCRVGFEFVDDETWKSEAANVRRSSMIWSMVSSSGVTPVGAGGPQGFC